MPITLTVNGQRRELDIDPDTPLLWAIRETLGLTGTKFGCGIAECGRAPCTSTAGRAVLHHAGIVGGRRHGDDHRRPRRGGALTPVQQAWLDLQVPQCGYCQSGMIMAVSALLEEAARHRRKSTPRSPTSAGGTFARIRKAIHGLTASEGGA